MLTGLVRSHCKLVATRALTPTTGPTAASRRDPRSKFVITPRRRDRPNSPSVIPPTLATGRRQCAHTQSASHPIHFSGVACDRISRCLDSRALMPLRLTLCWLCPNSGSWPMLIVCDLRNNEYLGMVTFNGINWQLFMVT